MDQNPIFKVVDRMSGKAFKQMNGTIQIKQCKEAVDQDGNPRHFFNAGEVTGFVSPKAASQILNEGNTDLNNYQFANVSKDGAAPIWCMMVVGNAQPVLVEM